MCLRRLQCPSTWWASSLARQAPPSSSCRPPQPPTSRLTRCVCVWLWAGGPWLRGYVGGGEGLTWWHAFRFLVVACIPISSGYNTARMLVQGSSWTHQGPASSGNAGHLDAAHPHASVVGMLGLVFRTLFRATPAVHCWLGATHVGSDGVGGCSCTDDGMTANVTPTGCTSKVQGFWQLHWLHWPGHGCFLVAAVDQRSASQHSPSYVAVYQCGTAQCTCTCMLL